MKSQAVVAGHPLHAMLVPFPFAFLIGAVVFDASAFVAGVPTLWMVGHYLAAAGLVMALVAAIPGLIDYLETVPPKSSAKRRATTHMTVNLTAVVLFGAAWLTRRIAEPEALVLLLEGVGAVALSVGGFMGGTLVYRNQIGVDHRYADAGRWREETVSARAGDVVTIATVDELKVGQMKLLRMNERRLVLARTNVGFAVFDDRCTHKGASLADGCLIDGTVQCPWHGSQFDVATGRVKAGPATSEIATWPVLVEGNDVRLKSLPPEPGRRDAARKGGSA